MPAVPAVRRVQPPTIRCPLDQASDRRRRGHGHDDDRSTPSFVDLPSQAMRAMPLVCYVQVITFPGLPARHQTSSPARACLPGR